MNEKKINSKAEFVAWCFERTLNPYDSRFSKEDVLKKVNEGVAFKVDEWLDELTKKPLLKFDGEDYTIRIKDDHPTKTFGE